MPPRSLRQTLGAFRAGSGDPTTRLSAGEFLQATYTPDGPGTLRLRWTRDPAPGAECGLAADAWGPGGAWLAERAAAFTGTDDDPTKAAHSLGDKPLIVTRTLRATCMRHVGASGNLYHAVLPAVVAQRITAHEALRQWRRLCRALGEPAPGPAAVVAGLVLPPSPAALRRRPAWWFHPLGIEAKRARALVEVARHHDALWRWADAGSETAAVKLPLIPGVGPWTAGTAIGPALGDPDTVPVGDFHFPNIVAWNLAGEARGDDARMLELLAPYAGQRGRVLHALVRAGQPAPAFGPRRRTLAIASL